MTVSPPTFLLVDCYDSFTYNLASLFARAIPDCTIHIIKNDQLAFTDIRPYLHELSAIIVGPGPGSPDNDADIGIVKDLWAVADADVVPIFGVCLGLQSLCLAYGATIKRLSAVKHGQLSFVEHSGTDIFEDVRSINAVRYHSLHAELRSEGCIEPLAWADDAENGRIIMAVKHVRRPYWAVQYHPESSQSSGGLEIVRNFWRLGQQWHARVGRKQLPLSINGRTFLGEPWPCLRSSHRPASADAPREVIFDAIHLPGLSITRLCEVLGVHDETNPFVMLDSAARPGRWSIIGSMMSSSPVIQYYADDAFVRITRDRRTEEEGLRGRPIWDWLTDYIRQRRAFGGRPEVPFWGGFIGCLSYEIGLQDLGVPLPQSKATARHPDVNLVFLERSLAFDTLTETLYIQSIRTDDGQWVADTSRTLQHLRTRLIELYHNTARKTSTSAPAEVQVHLPRKKTYVSRINEAKEHLYAGDSYELCLTARTTIRVPSLPQPCSSWQRYKRLRQLNPAPHAAYIRLNPTTFISSSPERFLSCTRGPDPVCQLRPIKGTLRKGPGITRAVAKRELAGSVKEVAENLMIVDLITHDLHHVVGEDVRVVKFCAVEEYETVWQLVSVIEGRPSPKAILTPTWDLGTRVLRHSLPPGSMTGAPKKRSVEILQTLEDDPRGIYSGVFGYWCVSGASDWAVTIRSCYKHDGAIGDAARDTTDGLVGDSGLEEWVMGAGGAITALSEPEAEWDEMLLKLRGVLRAFDIHSLDEYLVD
ncbi:ADC synthase [Schizophyllum fasciatum]